MLKTAYIMAETLTVAVKTARDMTEGERRAWMDMRAKNPALYSPYFHIEYIDLLAKHRDDVRVIIGYEDGQPSVILPVQGKGFARPVGAPMTDYHGFICAAGAQFDPAELLKSAGIGAYHFSAMIDNDNRLPHMDSQACAAIDIKDGADAWRAAQDGSYRRSLKSLRRRIRRTEEEQGEISVKLRSEDSEIFETMIGWKQRKFEETGKYDVLAAGWPLDIIRELWQRGVDAPLRCEMHALYFGDSLAAVDLGLTDGVTFHSWMVGYNPDFHAYSPGTQLLEKLVDAAHDLGYKIIDLGAGLEGYKKYYSGMDVRAASGFIAASGPAAALSKVYGAAESFGEKAPLGGLGRLPGKMRRRYSQIAACDPTAKGRTKAMLAAIKNSGKTS